MCRKGENIHKRKDGRWEARYIQWREPDGKIHYGSIYGKTYNEVRTKRIQKIAESPEYKRGGFCIAVSSPRQTTVEMVTEKWKQSARHKIKDSTFSNYEALLKNHILPELGFVPVYKLNSKQIVQFIQKKQETGLSNGTIRILLSILRSILKAAEKEGIYPKELIEYPHLSNFTQEVRIMSLKDYQKLEKYLITHLDNFCFGLLLCMHTGIRVGELSGLRWGDIDFPEKKLYIRRTVTRIQNLDHIQDPITNQVSKTILHVGSPKTEHSKRQIPLPDKLLLLGQIFYQTDETYLLTGTLQCMEPRIIQRKYAAILQTCHIPPIKIHALRHQFSCRWVECGFDIKSLSEILGHTSVRTTLDLYVHIQPETKRKFMNELIEKAI